MSGHPVFAAWYQRTARAFEAGPIGDARRDVVRAASGVVVDLGAGVGLNLPHLRPGVTHVHAVEPDPSMVRRLRAAVAARSPAAQPVPVTVHVSGAERLPLPDACADTVLATLVLCTVADPAGVAAEVRRVLRPGGRLLVLEHVLSEDPGLARWQRRLRRPWGWFAGGCSPARDTGAVLAGAPFDLSGLRRLRISELPVTPEWLAGAVVPR